MKIIPLAIPTPFYVGAVNVYLIKEDPLTLIDVGPKTEAAAAVLPQFVAQSVRRFNGFRSDINERQRVFFYQINVNRADVKRGWNCKRNNFHKYLGYEYHEYHEYHELEGKQNTKLSVESVR